MQKVTNFLRSLATEVLSRPLVVKALHSAWQAALAVLLVSNFSLDKGVLGAVIAAALSALKSSLVSYAKGRS